MDTPDLGAFGKFVPGFDFLQNLAKQATGGASAAIPGHWVAPTFNVEDLDKRIQELKAVQFWLDQNAKALGATVQALEVQRMTLATLQGMNMSMGDVAEALKIKPTPAPAPQPTESPAVARAAEPAPAPAAAPASGVDPMQWWSALTQQFQSIAENAMKDMASQAAQVTQAAAEAGAAAVSAPAPAPPRQRTTSASPAASRKAAAPAAGKTRATGAAKRATAPKRASGRGGA